MSEHYDGDIQRWVTEEMFEAATKFADEYVDYTPFPEDQLGSEHGDGASRLDVWHSDLRDAFIAG